MDITLRSTRTRAETAKRILAGIQRMAELQPDRPALVGDGGKGTTYTYAQLVQQILRLAAGLRWEGMVDRPEIGLLSENRPEWGIAYLAIIEAGGTVVPIDINLTPAEILFILESSKISTIFCSARQSAQLDLCDFKGKRISLDSAPGIDWRTLCRTAEYQSLTEIANDVAVLIYTSGTTGSPKAVELTQANLMHNLEGIHQAFGLGPHDVFLSVLPLHHTFEATCGLLTPLTCGARVVYARSLKSKEIIEDIGANGVTVMCGVPLLYEKMYFAMRRRIDEAPFLRRTLFESLYAVSGFFWNLGVNAGVGLLSSVRRKAGLSTVRIFMSGGAALPSEVSRFFTYLGFSFMQGYGMTECSPVISCNRPGHVRFDSAGEPLHNVEVRIDGTNEDGVGEIQVRGGSVTRGYRGNAEATRELFKGGWLRTGDLGRMHGNHVYITGRKKNVIISAAGKNIYPEELEEKLSLHPLVLEALVYGRKREGKLGEMIRAIIVPDVEYAVEIGAIEREQPDMDAVRDLIGEVVAGVNTQIADFKRIESFDMQLDELEKTSTRKIRRNRYQ